jgi:hypothetical protein
MQSMETRNPDIMERFDSNTEGFQEFFGFGSDRDIRRAGRKNCDDAACCGLGKPALQPRVPRSVEDRDRETARSFEEERPYVNRGESRDPSSIAPSREFLK